MTHRSASYSRLLQAGLALAVACFATACSKDKTTSADDADTGYAADHFALESASNETQTITDVAVTTNTVNGFLRTTAAAPTPLSGCATVSHDSTATPRTVTIDFGTANCLCGDGVYRRGKIVCTYTGRYKNAGAVHTITYQNYYRNDNQLTGSRTVTNNGTNSAGQYYYTVADSSSIILASGAGARSWVSTRTRTWTAGFGTAAWSDDAYSITGSGTITRANGKTFAVTIVSPLQVATNCSWIKAGTLTITPQSAAVRTLDYGTGSCDDSATLSVNGSVRTVTLR